MSNIAHKFHKQRIEARKDYFSNRVERDLTKGEIALAKVLFKDSLDYSEVKVHNHKYIFFQPKNSGMTPNGEMYIDGAYMADYSAGIPASKAFFLHEMTHVYQYQLNILSPVLAALGEMFEHMFSYEDAYKYILDKSRDLLDYDIEQQASIVEDYYRIYHLKLMPTANLQNKYTDAINNNLYKAVLAKFIANPSYAKHKIVCSQDTAHHHKTKIRKCNRVLAGK